MMMDIWVDLSQAIWDHSVHALFFFFLVKAYGCLSGQHKIIIDPFKSKHPILIRTLNTRCKARWQIQAQVLRDMIQS